MRSRTVTPRSNLNSGNFAASATIISSIAGCGTTRGGGLRPSSGNVTIRSSPRKRSTVAIDRFGKASSGWRSPASWSAEIPDGIRISPRNSREKSVCRSSNVTGTPRRASIEARRAPAGPAPTTIAPHILYFAGGLVVDQRGEAVAIERRFELADDRACDRDLLRGQTARWRDDFRIAQQAERAFERRAFHLRAVLKERAQVGAALDAEHDRQRRDAGAQIGAHRFADFFFRPQDVEQIVDHLKRQAHRGSEVRHPVDGPLRPPSQSRREPATGVEQRRGLAIDHLDIVGQGRRRAVTEPAFHHLAFGELDAGLRRGVDQTFLEAAGDLERAAEQG